MFCVLFGVFVCMWMFECMCECVVFLRMMCVRMMCVFGCIWYSLFYERNVLMGGGVMMSVVIVGS